MLNCNDYKFGWFEWSELHNDVDNPQINIRLGCGFAIDFYRIGFFSRRTLERTLTEKSLHESANRRTQLRPERFIIRFKDNPFCSSKE